MEIEALSVRFMSPDPTEWRVHYAENDASYRKTKRLLRKYSRVAWQSHTCSRCNTDIRWGDYYDAEVWLHTGVGAGRKKNRIVTHKYHLDPMCPDMKEFEDEMLYEAELEDERDVDAA